MTGRTRAGTVARASRRSRPTDGPSAGGHAPRQGRVVGRVATRAAPSSPADATMPRRRGGGWPTRASCPTTRWSRPPSAPGRRGTRSQPRPAGSLEPDFDAGLYAAGPEAALDLIRERPAATPRDVMVIGHNPTMAYLAQMLDDGGGDTEAGAAMAGGYPTSALTVLEFDGDVGRAGHGLRVGRRLPRRSGRGEQGLSAPVRARGAAAGRGMRVRRGRGPAARRDGSVRRRPRGPGGAPGRR